MSKPNLNSIGIFGGTFDPIHFGHLRSALEVQQAFNFDEMRLIPCHQPPHRTQPIVSAQHRLQMLKLAVQDSILKIDDREMRHPGPSYTVNTLLSLREEFPAHAICMTLGLDAFLSLSSWYQWEKLLPLANIVILHRKGWSFPEQGPMVDFLKEHRLKEGENLKDFPNGKITIQTIISLDIQASYIRALLQAGHSPEFLIPEKVFKYIQLNQLYGYNTGHKAPKEAILR